MATTSLTDVIIPEIYSKYQQENSTTKTEFINSGILRSNPILQSKANSGGYDINIPFWRDLEDSEPNLSDDTGNSATPQKITASSFKARVSYLNNAWASSDLVGELAGSEPMKRITSRTSEWWKRQLQTKSLAILKGVMLSNVANDSGDMRIDISIEDGDNAVDANKFNSEAFNDALFTMGDRFTDIKTIVMHTVVYQHLKKLDEISFQKPSENREIPYYQGLQVVIDDNMTKIAGSTSGFKYTTILYGNALLGFGSGSPKNPVEVDRSPLLGNGGGTETLIERKTWLIHPFGFNVATDPTGTSFTNAELASAATWNRVMDRKTIPLAFLVTNG